MTKNKKYWLVLEYDDSTGVDASNYVAWAYKDDNTYGERRAVYDSTESAWVVTDAENHIFDLYNNDLKLADDFSLIAVVKDTGLTVKTRSIMNVASMTTNINLLLQKYNGYYRFSCLDTAARDAFIYRQFNEFVILASTFNKAASTGKINFYANGKLEATTNGTAETANGQIAQPINIGSASWVDGKVTGYNNWKGYIGPVIMTSSTLTAAQVAEVTKSLICMRNAGVGV